jgi:RNA-directed DNA polymerase
MKIKFTHSYEDIISHENLLGAWREFLKGKRGKSDVQQFQYTLSDHLTELHRDLVNKVYKHGGYYAFNISDPKPRNIHKAAVRDRLVHHALYRTLYPFFDKTFISDSYSCQKGKGTHKALIQFERFARKASKNHTKTVWVLKCDIRKFFASIDQSSLLEIVGEYIPDKRIISLISEIVGSFSYLRPGIGLPLGNLTSQLLVNIYMNEFDQYVKHTLKAKYYLRYADDFAIMSDNRDWLESILIEIEMFLLNRLHLELHPQKVSIRTIASGVDFLGWTHFPDHRVLRSTTKRRMVRSLREDQRSEVYTSYIGLLSHGNTYKIRTSLENDPGILS